MLAIIPAKSLSKRLPNKNIKKLAGKPLIAYTIECALKSKKIKRLIVSTDSKKIAKIAIKYGAEVPFLRNKKFTKDKTTSWEVLKDLLKKLKLIENKSYESLIYLQPTSPLRLVKDIDNSIKIFRKKNANAIVSVNKAKPSFWFKNIKDNGLLIEKEKINKKINYILNGSIYIFKTSFIKKTKPNIYDKKTFAYIMPLERSVDIDTLYDFKIAEMLIKKNK
jgi:CMP-N,N'-diacetyllegionaminic acid synthase